jgi:hypothetical protein
MDFMNEQIKKYSTNTTDAQLSLFWHHINLIKLQIEGMYHGYTQQVKTPKMKLVDFYRFQMDGDIEDLYGVLDPQEVSTRRQAERILLYRTHCSALLKYTPDRSELMATQSTWDVYNNMLRIYKHIEIPFTQKEQVATTAVSFSSSPGWLISVDDFYVTQQSNLVILETTNGVYDTSIYKHVTPKSVLYWMRNIVANRLATSGKSWGEWFGMYNSGTYNNQWIVVDYKKFVPKAQKSDPELVFMMELMPNMIRSQYVSELLDSQNYLPSYNIPFHPDIFKYSGTAEMEKKYGQDFGYQTCPRAKIFKRDQHTVVDMKSFQALIRQNKFENDPFAEGDACKQIAARCDLNPTQGDNSSAFGQIDAKVTNNELSKKRAALCQCGPTTYSQKAFEWKDWKDEPHAGQPTKFAFDWVHMQPQ